MSPSTSDPSLAAPLGGTGAITGIGAPIDTEKLSSTAPASIPDEQRQHEHNEHDDKYDHPLAKLGSARKHFLLFIFSVASFLDICNVSGAAIAVAQISVDIQIESSQIVWVSHYFASLDGSFIWMAVIVMCRAGGCCVVGIGRMEKG